MKIKIKYNASTLYLRLIPRVASVNWDWYNILKKIENRVLTVGIEHLFYYQFNTESLPNISGAGLRIPLELVEYVIDDARYGKMNCAHCGLTQRKAKRCKKCKLCGNLVIFNDYILNKQQKKLGLKY